MNRRERHESIKMALAEWNEADHPRDENGRFGSGGGSSTTHDVPEDLQNRHTIQIGDSKTTGSVKVAGGAGLYDMSSKGLEENLKNGSFSIMTAANPMGKPLDDATNEKLNEKLKIDLMKHGAIFHAVQGVYTNDAGVTTKEPSFMIHHAGMIRPSFIEQLGNRYKQESVLHYTKGDTTIRYTSGPKMGQDMLKLKGHTTEPASDVPQTHVPGAGKFAVGSEQPKARTNIGFEIDTADGKKVSVKFGK